MALTRGVSPALARCELTHAERVPIDVERAVAQHAAYERALEELGCAVHRLPVDPELADSVFVEDTAVVLDEIAIVARPGAASRRGEIRAVEEWLKHHRLLGHITDPATLDGGDVLVAGRTVFVGRSSRTNADGIDQLGQLATYFGYSLREITVRGCLHLKSAVTAVDDRTLLINDRWVDAAAFDRFEAIAVDREEPGAANVLRVGERLLCAAAFPRTRACLDQRGYTTVAVDVSELAKAEGAVTCCSLIVRGDPA